MLENWRHDTVLQSRLRKGIESRTFGLPFFFFCEVDEIRILGHDSWSSIPQVRAGGGVDGVGMPMIHAAAPRSISRSPPVIFDFGRPRATVGVKGMGSYVNMSPDSHVDRGVGRNSAHRARRCPVRSPELWPKPILSCSMETKVVDPPSSRLKYDISWSRERKEGWW